MTSVPHGGSVDPTNEQSRGVLNADDLLVLDALKLACARAGHCVHAAAVAAELDELKRARFAARAEAGAIAVVRGRLAKLDNYRVIESPGFCGMLRLYGLEGTPVPVGVRPEAWSEQQDCVLRLVRAAAEVLERPVRISDVLRIGGEEAVNLGPALQSQLWSLRRAGMLKLMAVNAGRGDGGTHHYLPTDLVEKYGGARLTESFNDVLLRAFGELWKEHAVTAAALGQKPAPILLGELAEKVASVLPPGADTSSERVMGAIRNFERLSRPKVRCLRLGNPPVNTWIPIHVLPDEINHAIYQATDCKRVSEAASRASARTSHAAVCLLDVYREIEKDATLALQGTDSLSGVIDSAARVALSRPGRRSVRVVPYLTALGTADGVAFYCQVGNEERARYEMLLRRFVEREANEELADEKRRLGESLNPQSALARAKNVVRACGIFVSGYSRYAHDVTLADDLRVMAAEHLDMVRAIQDEVCAEHHVERVADLSGQLSEFVDFPTINIRELHDIARVILGDSGMSTEAVAKVVGKAVRRVPNPRFAHKSTRDPDTSTQWVYDRAEALMTLADDHGGREARLAAIMARRELGLCRSPAVVLEAMYAPDVEGRLAAISAAAFIGGPRLLQQLVSVAKDDSAPASRLQAFWSLGFAGGPEVAAAMHALAEGEPDPEIQGAMRMMIDDAVGSRGGWWSV